MTSITRDRPTHLHSTLTCTGEPPLAELEGHGGAISTLVLYGRGARCAAASHDGAAIIWDVASGARLSALVGGGGRMTTLIIEPRLERFALTATDDGGAAVWSLDGSVRRVAPLRGLTSYITAGAFLPSYRRGAGAPDDLADRTLVATAGGDGAVAVWDCMSGQRLRLLSGHCEEVLSLDVSAKGRFLLTSSADGTCRVWDLHSNVIEPPVPHLGGVQARPSPRPLWPRPDALASPACRTLRVVAGVPARATCCTLGLKCCACRARSPSARLASFSPVATMRALRSGTASAFRRPPLASPRARPRCTRLS